MNHYLMYGGKNRNDVTIFAAKLFRDIDQYMNLKRIRKISFGKFLKAKKKKKGINCNSVNAMNNLADTKFHVSRKASNYPHQFFFFLLPNSKKLSNWLSYEAIKEQHSRLIFQSISEEKSRVKKERTGKDRRTGLDQFYVPRIDRLSDGGTKERRVKRRGPRPCYAPALRCTSAPSIRACNASFFPLLSSYRSVPFRSFPLSFPCSLPDTRFETLPRC